jgi:hypothetical protein
MNILRREDFVGVDKNNFIDKNYSIHSAIILNNIGSKPRYLFIDEQKEEYKTCRFCGKTQHDVPFDNKSHVVPKFLGNFLVLSNSECDECNSFFSKYETELEKYVKIPLIANTKDDLKDRYGKNISRIGDDIIINGEREKVEFNGIYVFKIFLKFAYSMLNKDELHNYDNIRKTIIDENKTIVNSNILDFTLRKPFDWNSVILYEKKQDFDGVDNILVLNFNMKKYIVFFNKDESTFILSEEEINDKYFKLFNDNDIYNYRVRDLNRKNLHINFKIDIFMNFIKENLK